MPYMSFRCSDLQAIADFLDTRSGRLAEGSGALIREEQLPTTLQQA
jgi:hypothetical protein